MTRPTPATPVPAQASGLRAYQWKNGSRPPEACAGLIEPIVLLVETLTAPELVRAAGDGEGSARLAPGAIAPGAVAPGAGGAMFVAGGCAGAGVSAPGGAEVGAAVGVAGARRQAASRGVATVRAQGERRG